MKSAVLRQDATRPQSVWSDLAARLDGASARDLESLAERYGWLLRESLGLVPGDRVFVLYEPVPALCAGALGAIDAGLVVGRLMPEAGAREIRATLEQAGAKAVLTTREFFEDKLEDFVPQLASLHHVLVTGEALDSLLAEAADTY